MIMVEQYILTNNNTQQKTDKCPFLWKRNKMSRSTTFYKNLGPW